MSYRPTFFDAKKGVVAPNFLAVFCGNRHKYLLRLRDAISLMQAGYVPTHDEALISFIAHTRVKRASASDRDVRRANTA